MNVNRLLLSVLVAGSLVGCASSVKLDPAPVEDRNAAGAAATAGSSGAEGGAVGARDVTGVNLNKGADTAAGPAGSRIVYFDFDSYVVKPEFQGVLDAQASYLKAGKGRKASIEGHTDERGGREYNLALGQKRAEAVRRALALLGVPDAQMDAVSFGKEKPAELGGSEAAMAKNRRAEVTYRP